MPDQSLNTLLESVLARLINVERRIEQQGDRLADKIDDAVNESKSHTDIHINELKKTLSSIEEKRVRPLEIEMATIKGKASGVSALISFVISLAGVVVAYFTGGGKL